MSRFIIVAFAFMVLFSMATASECPENQEYQECGTACPPTCAKPNPGICTLQCVAGCFCKAGLVKNSKGKCVKPCQC